VGIDWKPVEPAYPAPDFTLSSLDGNPVTLSTLQGRVVLLEFWASWCGPCRYSTPSLERIYREFRQHGVEVLLVNARESPEVVRKWAGTRFSATILLDREGEVAERYGVRGIPRLFVIDQTGQIRYDEGGYAGALEMTLRRILRDLLSSHERPRAA